MIPRWRVGLTGRAIKYNDGQRGDYPEDRVMAKGKKPIQGPTKPRQRTQAATLAMPAERPPLRVDEGGAIRIGTSRIPLDLVVSEYENGMTPEDMVRAYATLELPD